MVLGRRHGAIDFVQAARDAVWQTAERQLEDSTDTGIGGLENLARIIPQWASRLDRSWCAKFGYQVIEKRGTGGALFRRLYGKFLREAGEVFGARELMVLSPQIEDIANGWSVFASQLKVLGDGGSTDFEAASATAAQLADRERALWATARDLSVSFRSVR